MSRYELLRDSFNAELILSNDLESLGKIGTRRADFGNILGLDKREAVRRGKLAAKFRKKVKDNPGDVQPSDANELITERLRLDSDIDELTTKLKKKEGELESSSLDGDAGVQAATDSVNDMKQRLEEMKKKKKLDEEELTSEDSATSTPDENEIMERDLDRSRMESALGLYESVVAVDDKTRDSFMQEANEREPDPGTVEMDMGPGLPGA